MLLGSIIFFLMLSALFSGTEIAYVSANRLRIELNKKKGTRRSEILTAFYEKPSFFLSTMLVGNNIALVVFTFLMTKVLEPYFKQWIPSEVLLLLVITIVITIIVLIFGEFLPKTLFSLFADRVLYFLAYPLRFLQYILAIPAWVMTKASNRLLQWVFKTPLEQSEAGFFTRLELQSFIQNSITDQEETIDKALFENALHLNEVRVKDCMIPRPEIVAVDVNDPILQVEETFKQSNFSRLIVIENDIDNILGYIHHQQLFKKPKHIKNLVMEIPFVPEVMKVKDLMNWLIKEHTNMACVVNEFGGVAGIITLEDILEEIFGEIEDEHDEEEHLEVQLSTSEFLFSGRLEIAYLNEKYGLSFTDGDYHTLSGYVVMTMGEIPDQGTVFEMDGYNFILEQVSDTKIDTIRVIQQMQDRTE